MPQYVEVVGIGQIEFPDWMSKEEIGNALKMLPVPKTKKQLESGDWRDSVLGGFVRGLRDVPDAGAQALTRALEGLMPAGSSAEQFFKSERQRVEDINRAAEQEYQQQWRQGQMVGNVDVGRTLGQIAATAVPAAKAVQAAGAVTAPIRAGGISGTLSAPLTEQVITQPGQDMTTGQFMAQKVEQAGAGGLSGMAGGYLFDKLGRVIAGRPQPAQPTVVQPGQASANVSAQVTPTAQVTGGGSTLGQVGVDPTSTLTEAQRAIMQRGRQLGFQLTPGQTVGSRSLQQMEARMEANPFFSGPFNTIKQQNQDVLNRQVARSIGEDTSELSAPVLGRAADRIGSVFQAAADPNPRPIDSNQLAMSLQSIASRFEDVTNKPVIEQPLVQKLLKFAEEGRASGEQLQSLSSKLGKVAKKEMTSASGDRDMGEALFMVKELVDDSLMQGLPEAQQRALMQARQQYRNLMSIETGGVVNPASGNVSGVQLANVLQRKDKTGYLRGATQSDLYDAARFAQAFKPIVGDSGTATRSMELTPMNMLLSMPTNLAARAYASAPTTSIMRATQGPGIAENLLTEEQRRLLRALSPVAGGLTASQTLTGGR